MPSVTTATAVTFGVYHDFRCLDQAPSALTRHWRAVIEQIQYAERLGFGSVWVSEHHFVEDNYASSTTTLLAALATATTNMWLGSNVMVLPVQHPLRLAEDALTIDALSGGRLRLGMGLGYRAADLGPFELTLSQRRQVFEAHFDVLRRACRGEDIDGYRVSPRPVREGGPELWIGALSPPAIDRAARLADGFICVLPNQIGEYVQARARLALDAGRVAVGNQWIVAEDPERAWAAVGRHVLYQHNAYIDFGMFGHPETTPRLHDPQQLLDIGMWRLLDADAAIDELVRQSSAGPVVDFFSWTAFPGEPLEQATERLEYLAAKVIPEVRNRLD